MNNRPTPETDAEIYPMNGVDIVWPEFARKLERERDELRRMSVIEMMGHNLNVKHHVTEWENRCIKAEQERDEAREELYDIRLNLGEDAEGYTLIHAVCVLQQERDDARDELSKILKNE